MRTRFGRRYPRDEQGAVVVLTAILMVALILFAAIVVDLGMARDVRRQSQNAADAASLAGANALYPSSKLCNPPVVGGPPCIADAVAKVKSYASSNFQVKDSDWSACTATLPGGFVPSAATSCISFDSVTSPTLVLVNMPTRNVSTAFGNIIGKSSIAVGSSAQAQLGVAVTCSLCFLGGVDVENADFTVLDAAGNPDGAIAVNGDLNGHKNSNWISKMNGVVGTVDGVTFKPASTTIPAFGDPLAGLTMPDTTGLPTSLKTDPCAQGPGFYGDVNLPKSACTLQKGLYVISGTWLSDNKTVLQDLGAGVTLYVTSPNGYLNFKNGNVAITAPAAGQPNAGYAIIYDRDNGNNLGLQGNGNTSIAGVVYAKKSKLDFNGNSCFGFSKGPVVVLGLIKANGNKSCVTITNAVELEVTRTLLHLNK